MRLVCYWHNFCYLLRYVIQRSRVTARTRPDEGTMAIVYTNGNTDYKGKDRRKISRRNVAERRKEIRWEPKNPNRRQNTGRRASDLLGVNSTKR
jgi:hypothetical protein